MNTNYIDQIPKSIIDLIELFNKNNHQVYLVGGAVRDLLMGKKASDWDLTTDAQPEQILQLIPNGYYNNKFGTVGIEATKLDKNNEDLNLGVFEITTMRRESGYNDYRHPDKIEWTDKIFEDLGRRDFTINAIALKVDFQSHQLEIIDPFEGWLDIQNRVIKTVRDPDARFKEDALRLLRAIRFSSQLLFNIENKTLDSLQKNKDLIAEVSMERIRDELFKIFNSQDSYSGMNLLKTTGILSIILPEVNILFDVMQEGPKHNRIYNIGEHSFLTLKYTPYNDSITKLAALIHDVGKYKTKSVEEDGNVTFYNHDVVGGEIALNIADRLKLSKEQKDKLFRLVRWHLFTVDEKQTDSAIRRFIKNVGIENIDDMIALRIGDRIGGGTEKAVSWRMEKFQEKIKKVLEKPFNLSDLKINGNDIMNELNLPPSKKVGDILNRLFHEVQNDVNKNDRTYLLKRAHELSR